MFDFHIHSDFSIDSKAPMEKTVIAAIENNLKTICFTDHVDFDATLDRADLMFHPLDYFRSVNKVKYKYKDKLEVLAGVEIGMQPHLLDKYNKFINEHNFDFVIMSLHTIDNKDIFQDYTEIEKSSLTIIRKYYKELLICVKEYDNFDVLGHIDFIDRYIVDKSIIENYDEFMAIIKEILTTIIAKGKGIELNTASLRQGLDYIHPKPSILKMYKDLGGEVVTIGSDAHFSEDIGSDYKFAENILRELGFKNVYIFRNRKKYPLRIL
jgi:histidinol-phosphatase (PHP family)